jgi:hypothetical protein
MFKSLQRVRECENDFIILLPTKKRINELSPKFLSSRIFEVIKPEYFYSSIRQHDMLLIIFCQLNLW